MLPVDRWDSLQGAHDIQAPSLVLHGGKDIMIAPWHSENLARNLDSAPVQRVVIGQAGHNTLLNYAQYRQSVSSFLRQF